MPKKPASSKQKSYKEEFSSSESSSGASSGASQASSAVSSDASDSSSGKSSITRPIKPAVSKASPSSASETSDASAITTSGSESSDAKYQPAKNAKTSGGKPIQVRVQADSPSSSTASSPVSASSESRSSKEPSKKQKGAIKPSPKKPSKKQVHESDEESGSASDISDDSILSLSDPRLSKKPQSSATSQTKSSAGAKPHADIKIETLNIAANGRSMPSATSSRSEESQSLVLTPDGHQAVVIMASGKDVPLASSDEELSEGGRWKVMKKHGKSATVGEQKAETTPSGKSKAGKTSSKKQKDDVREPVTPKRKVFTSTKQAAPVSASSSSSNGSSNTDSSDSVSSSLIESIRQKQALERKRNAEKSASETIVPARPDDEEDDDEPLHAVLAKSDSNAPIGASAMFQAQQPLQQQGYYPPQPPQLQQYPGMMYAPQMMPGMMPGMVPGMPMAAGYAMPMQGYYPPPMPQQPQMAMYNGVPQQQQQYYQEPDDLTPFDSVSNAPSGGRVLQQAGQFQQYAPPMPVYQQAAQPTVMYPQRPGQMVSPPQPQYLQQQQAQHAQQQAYQMQMMQMQQQQQMMQNNSRKGGATNMPEWVNEHKPKIGGEGTLMEQVKRGRELPNGNSQMNLIENIQYDPKKGQVPMMSRPQQQQQQFQPGMPGMQPGMQHGYYGMQPGMMQPGMTMVPQGYGGQMMNGYQQQYPQNGP